MAKPKKVRGQSASNVSPKKPPRVQGPRKTRKGGKKPVNNPTVKLNQSSWKWANERDGAARSDQYMRDVKEQVKTGNALRQRGLKINESNWKRYHRSKES